MFSSSKTVVLLGLLVPFSLAQYGGGPVAAPAQTSTSSSSVGAAAASTSSSSAAATATMVAGLNGDTDLSFSPNSVTAAPGTFVEIQFMPVNHSVAQSSFENPCNPLNSSAFFAGFVFDTSSGPASNVFTLQVSGTDPIWFYCPQTTDGIHHCAKGMVGVINPPSGQTPADFVANAMATNVTVSVPPTIQGGIVGPAAAVSPSSTSATGSAASASPTSSSSHITVGMGLVGFVSIVFSALLSF